MNRKKTCITFFIVILMTIGYLFSQEESNKQKPEEMLIEGEVVDLACFTSRELSGEGHKSCASRCLTRGTPAGLVDQAGNVFVIIGPSPGYAPYAAQTIRLNGSVEGGRISPKKMEAKAGETWEKVKLSGGAPNTK